MNRRKFGASVIAGAVAGLLRLEQAGVSTARAWLAMQANYELWQAMQHEQPPVRALQDAAA